MRKLKGITIEGEWLGENVEINGLFRSICSISPVVMREFVRLINKIEMLDEAVKVKSFEFPDNNSIAISFANSYIQGTANLYFKLNNGKPEFIEGKITTNIEKEEQEIEQNQQAEEQVSQYKDLEMPAEKIIIPENSTNINENTIIEDDINTVENENITETEVKTEIETTQTECEVEIETEAQTELETTQTEGDVEVETEIKNLNHIEEFDINNQNIGNLTNENLSNSIEISENATDSIVETNNTKDEKIFSQNDAPEISTSIEESTQDKQEPVNLQESKPNTSENNSNNHASEVGALLKETNIVQTISEAQLELTAEPKSVTKNMINSAQPNTPSNNIIVNLPQNDIPTEQTSVQHNYKEEFTQNIEENNYNENKYSQITENISFEDSSNIQNTEVSSETTEDIPNNDIPSENHKETDCVTENIETINDTPINILNFEKDNITNSNEKIADEEQEICDFYSDFYTTNNTQTTQIKEFNTYISRNVLAELEALKAEFKDWKFRTRPRRKKISLKEFLESNAESKVDSYGEEFRVVVDGHGSDANLVEENLFIAGNKLYKWGDTLYLED